MCSDIGISCQGIYRVNDKSKLYTEVLIRRYKSIRGADNIICWAHKVDRCKELDENIIEYTLQLLNDINDDDGEIRYAFNLCDRTIGISGEADRIIDIIDKYSRRDKVLIEITEDTDFSNDIAVTNIRRLANSGIGVVLDDFGRSNSNIEAIMNISFSIVKIDKDYIRMAMKTRRQLKILAGVIKLLDNLNITTVVEGVETLEHLDIVRKIGAEAVQGYLLEVPRAIQ